MQPISGYNVLQKLYESANSMVYRATRSHDNQPVILKTLREAYPSPERVAWFKREYEVTRKLNLTGVVNVYNLTYCLVGSSDQKKWVMELEDFGGDSLSYLKLAGKLPLPDLLTLSINITDILGQIHQLHIVHKDINPANIIFNPQTLQVKIIDFGISTVLSQESQAFQPPNALEGTLGYISPEQTGRMNRAIDYRTDFYSFGVTLYELLTGQLPFPTDNMLELIHNHIAKQPTPPHELVEVPTIVSDIILRLMAKNAENRYQSAFGLRSDLEVCLRQWQAVFDIITFPLGKHDVSVRFQIPQKLYGRDHEITTVLMAFDRIAAARQPKGELVLLTGYAGVGKSAVVYEVHKPITAKRGYFITGKYDQYQRDTPYFALSQALNEFCNQILTESADMLAQWKERIMAAVGDNGQLIIEVVSQLQVVLGPQPPVVPLGPQESQNRFNLIFQKFIQAISHSDHPLVMFIDDLQWADMASLNILKVILGGEHQQALLIVGAYRDNEVSAAHPLTTTLAEIQQHNTTVTTINLQNLTADDVNELIKETLSSDAKYVNSLAELVYGKTQGNAFFTIEFLKTLHAEELLTFDYRKRLWRWRVGRILAKNITDNVVELMAGKISQLRFSTRQVLQLAACIGNSFDLATLAIIYRPVLENSEPLKPAQILGELWPAIQEGLIMPLNDRYKLIEVTEETDSQPSSVIFKFQHDRVQQAAYSLLSDDEKQSSHLHIGRLLLANAKQEGQLEEHIFDVANQLNKAIPFITDQVEQIQLAELNLMAGRKAKASAAHQPALNYLQTGLTLVSTLDLKLWQTHYNLMLALHEEAAESAYLSGHFEQMDTLVTAVLEHGQSILDKIKTYETQILAYIAQSKHQAALQIGLPVLKELIGVYLPEKPNYGHLGLGFAQTMLTLGRYHYVQRHTIEELANLPEMTDPYKLVAIQLMNNVEFAAFISMPELFILIVLKKVWLSVNYGNSSASAEAYATYGTVLCGAMNEIESGYRFGNLALKLLAQNLAWHRYGSGAYLVINVSVRFWKEHLRNTLVAVLEAHQVALVAGRLDNAAYLLFAYAYHAYFSGYVLIDLEKELIKYGAMIKEYNQEIVLRMYPIYWQAVLNLLHQSNNPTELVGEQYDEQVMVERCLKANDQSTLGNFYIQKIYLSYLFQNYQQAIDNATQAEKYLEAAMATYVVPIFHLYDSLAHLALCPTVDKAQQKKWLKRIAANQKKMKKWADHAPMNFLHKFYLVEAERARVADILLPNIQKEGEARILYDQAIALARENEYLNEEALAYELAGKFYLAKGRSQLAQNYLREAHYAYQRWGATTKAKAMEAQYGRLLTPQSLTLRDEKRVTPATFSKNDAISQKLDVYSLLKASETLAGEIVLNKLLEKLMRVIIENAGAQRGFLLLERAGQEADEVAEWVIEAEGSIDKQQLKIRPAMSMVGAYGVSAVPSSIINYVARAQEAVVLNNASREGAFTQDSYIVAQQPQSVLCTPLINQGKVVGIVYLENNLTTDAFTSDRLEILNLLSAQAAVSLQNARLYSNLHANERKYRALFEDSKDVIFIINTTGQIIDVSPACENLWGYSRAAMREMNLLAVLVQEDDHLHFLMAIEQPGSVKDFPMSFQHRDGSKRDCLITATVRQSNEGLIFGYQGIIRDVTEQKRAEQERMLLLSIQRELGIAQEIQDSLLPSANPHWSDINLACYTMSAREVGGDFYVYHAAHQPTQLSSKPIDLPPRKTGPLSSSSQVSNPPRPRSMTPALMPITAVESPIYAIAVGDVSGKGVPASLLMAVSLASFRAIVEQNLSPGELLRQMDKAIANYTHTTHQNCALVCIQIELNPSDEAFASHYAVLRAANAGCVTPLVKYADGSVEWVEVGGMPLGVGLGAQFGYQEMTLGLSKGDLIVLTSDGVVEANNVQGEMFGFDRLQEVVLHGPQESVDAMLQHVKQAVTAFVGDREPHDDLTIVVVKI